ncbi:MAG: phosphatase PAP2 family protein, partial [Deltaproteobacteria bacterium]|nr:phosphatase PAP2 family protein [Deltaproteobacteria bacterium]
TVLLAAVFLLPPLCRGEESLTLRLERDARVLKGDYRRFYLDPDNIMSLVGVGAVSGIFANTDIDREFQEYYRDDIKSRWTNGASKVLRAPGELIVALPVLFGAHMILDEKTPAGEWADKSLRALLVGGPAGLFIRSLTGASRPNEGGSQWRPFADRNGLSGHAFVGAVPFITAARMQDDPCMKALLYTISALPAATRVNDDRHYLSQVMLGWYLAYLSAAAVDTEESADDISFFIVPTANNGILLRASIEY